MLSDLSEDCPGVCAQNCYNFFYFGNTLFSGLCLLIAMILAGIQTVRHLRNYTNPHFQNKILSIIFAAPFYGITSYLTIVTQDSVGFWIVLRTIYDSFLIYFFFNLITSYVTFDEGEIKMEIIYEVLHEKGEIPHSFPAKYWLKPIKITSTDRARFFYLTCKNWMMQFFVLNALLIIFNCILSLIGGLQIWIDINNAILFISICFCLYYLVLFYVGLETVLKPYRPLLKFLAIKGIIFFTFWQEMAISAFQNSLLGLFKKCEINDFQDHAVLNSASCMLVCFEMIILTIMTSIAYSYKDFESAVKAPLKKRLIFNVLSENIKEQLHDLSQYDMLKNLPLPMTNKKKVAKISEKETTTSYYDEDGNLIDAKLETRTKLYQDRIEVIPNSLAVQEEKEMKRTDFHTLE